jgi:hypothetical protein
MTVNLRPVKNVLMPYKSIALWSGYWFMGTNITEGRYTATVSNGHGNFIVYDKDSKVIVNEILGGRVGVEKVVANLKNGDMTNISGLNNIKFTPYK